MAFSAGVKLGDLDDFISAAQDCIVPLIQAAGGGTAKLDSTSDGLRNLEPRTGSTPATVVQEVPLVQRPNLIKSKKSADNPKAEIGQVTLSDCLACSGCVTSAETVLLQAQSVEEFLRTVREAPVTVVTISPEARVSLAAQSGAEPLLTLQRIASALQTLGVTYVLETSAAEAIALLEGKADFLRRYRQVKSPVSKQTAQRLPLLTSHCPGWTCYAEKVVDPVVLPHLSPMRPPQQIQGRLVKTLMLEQHNRRRFHRWWRSRSPLFAAECGWWLRSVASADCGTASSAAAATAAASVPASSSSPAPVASVPSGVGGEGGTLLGPADVYHVSVQPCFDRKIEAARPQFQLADEVREVDTVLTTTELLELVLRAHSGAVSEDSLPASASTAEATEAGIAALQAMPPCALSSEVLTDILLRDLRCGRPEGRPLLCGVAGNAESGGFAEFVFREAARELFQKDISGSVNLVVKQNEDMREVVLKDDKQRVLLKFVSAYGFRNIQNVIRKVVKASSEGVGQECGHFIEIMACPGGCVNGGGQALAPKLVPPPPGSAPDVVKAHADVTRDERRRRLDELEASLRSGGGVAVVTPADHPLVLPIYREIQRLAAVHSDSSGQAELSSLIGGTAVRSFLGAQWRSLKVGADGKLVVGTSALRW